MWGGGGCSQWYNLFFPLNLISLSLSRSLSPFLTPCYSITRLQDALTLSPFSSYAAVSKGVWKSSAQQDALCSAQTRQCASDAAHSHKRGKTCTCGSALQNTEPTRGSDKMWIISNPAGSPEQTKGAAHACIHTYMHIHLHSCVHDHARIHARDTWSRVKQRVDVRGFTKLLCNRLNSAAGAESGL